MSYTTLCARALPLIAVCLFGVSDFCWADDDQQERREVRIEVRRDADEEGQRSVSRNQRREDDQDRREVRVEVRREERDRVERRGSNRDRDVQRREGDRRRPTPDQRRPNRALRSVRIDEDRSEGRHRLTLELNLPPGADVHAQIERVIDELKQRLARELHGEQRPRPQHDDNRDRGRPHEPDPRQHHLANAIEHLQAAGLHDEAHQLRERFDDLLSRPAGEHAEHREEQAPPHDAHREAPPKLLREIEDRMHHFERAVDDIRHESGRRFEELERAFREHIQRLEREVSERLEELARHVEESRRN